MRQVTGDVQHALAGFVEIIAPDLDQVLVAGRSQERDLRGQAVTEVVIALDHGVETRITVAPVIDCELRVKGAATKTDGNGARARCKIAIPYVRACHAVPRAIERRAQGVERQIRHVIDWPGFAAVVVFKRTRMRVTTDSHHAPALDGGMVAPNFDQVLFAGDHRESHFRLPTMEVVVALYKTLEGRIAITSVIDGELGIKITSDQTDGGPARARGGIAVPDVRAVYVVPGTVERCLARIERQVVHIADGLGSVAVVVGWADCSRRNQNTRSYVCGTEQ